MASNNLGGRPPIISVKEKRDKIIANMVEKLSHGMPIYHACEAASLPRTSFSRYRAVGREVEEKIHEMGLDAPDDSFDDYQKGCWELWTKTKAAEVQAYDRNLLSIMVAAQDSWQAAAWYLERRYPKEFARTTKIEGGDGKPVKVNVKVDDRRAKVINALSVLPVETLRALEQVGDVLEGSNEVAPE